jgi:CheY-like chemotaxis protein
MPEISVLLVGSTFRGEFREARGSLDRLSRVVPAMDVATAVAAIENGRVVPDLIVVAQAFPGQFSVESVDRLRRLAPLAPVVGLLGSWCEGEMRTGEPWPGAVRVYWHQWAARCQQELGRLQSGNCSSWGLPATAGDEEHLLAAVGPPRSQCRQEDRRGQILVRSPEFDMQDWLAAACRIRGYQTEWLRPGQPAPAEDAAAVIFDFGEWLESELADFARLAGELPGVPLIALMGFPRIEDRDRALAAGAAAVLSKPLLVEDLFWELHSLQATASAIAENHDGG